MFNFIYYIYKYIHIYIIFNIFKLKNLNEYPSIQLVSINEIIGNYNKKLLIHGILSPLLAESNFGKNKIK